MSDLIPRSIKLKPIRIDMGSGSLFEAKVNGRLPDVKRAITEAINRASLQIAIDLKAALDAAMKSGIWNGEDIYDTGELMNSGRVEVNNGNLRIVYDAPYATLVAYGGYIHPYGNINARVYLPPRPWIEAVVKGGYGIEKFDFKSYYERAITEALRAL